MTLKVPAVPPSQDNALALSTIAQALSLRAEIANTRPVNVVNSFGATTPLPGSHGNKVRGYFSILSPGQTGLAPDELKALFARDQAPQEPFWHRLFAFDAAGELRQGLALASPLRAQELQTAAQHIPFGVLATAAGARHVAFAQNGAMQLAGFVDFSVTIGPEATEQEVAEYPAKGATVRLTVTLAQLYSRNSLRGTGTAAALLEFIGDVVQAELETLVARLKPAAADAGYTLVVDLGVETACDSQAAYMLQGLLEETLANCMLSMAHQPDGLGGDFDSPVLN